MLCLLITVAIFSLILLFNMCMRNKARQCRLCDYAAFVSWASSCGSDRLSWRPCWTADQMSLVELRVCGGLPEQLEQMAKVIFAPLFKAVCAACGPSALPHKGLSGISAASRCLDNSSGQQHFFQNALRSHFCNALNTLGWKALQEQK